MGILRVDRIDRTRRKLSSVVCADMNVMSAGPKRRGENLNISVVRT